MYRIKKSKNFFSISNTLPPTLVILCAQHDIKNDDLLSACANSKKVRQKKSKKKSEKKIEKKNRVQLVRPA